MQLIMVFVTLLAGWAPRDVQPLRQVGYSPWVDVGQYGSNTTLRINSTWAYNGSPGDQYQVWVKEGFQKIYFWVRSRYDASSKWGRWKKVTMNCKEHGTAVANVTFGIKAQSLWGSCTSGDYELYLRANHTLVKTQHATRKPR